MSTIQWYPGHMAKTKRLLSENLKLVDLVIEVLDSRIPKSSRNPDFNKLLADKKRIILLNKEDLADPKISLLWREYFTRNDTEAIFTNLKTGNGLKSIREALKRISVDKIARQASKGVKNRPVRVMIAGIPNSGKSTLINMLAGRSSAKTGDIPGVTKSKQWVRLDGGIDLLDTPGILWPKFEDEKTALNLSFTGAIKDSITDTTEIAEKLLRQILLSYPGCLITRYKISLQETDEYSNEIREYMLLDAVARKRGFLLPGGEVDLNRASTIVLDEFRAAKIGRISLEEPPS